MLKIHSLPLLFTIYAKEFSQMKKELIGHYLIEDATIILILHNNFTCIHYIE